MIREIRSYVRREGRITSSQRRSLETLWPKYGLEFSVTPLDFSAIFGRIAPLVLEIGFGMGHSLLELAQSDLDSNYIGAEVFRPGVGSLLLGLEREELHNVRVFNADAVEVLCSSIADNSLSRVLIFFPDPWPKKRHHKRRLIQPEFIELIAAKLLVGGVLHLATDWQNYAEQMLEVVSQSKSFVNCAGAGNYSPRPDYRPLTKFEQRGKRLGHGVWDLLLHKN